VENECTSGSTAPLVYQYSLNQWKRKENCLRTPDVTPCRPSISRVGSIIAPQHSTDVQVSVKTELPRPIHLWWT